MELEMNWLDQINEEIENNVPSIANEREQWKKHSIYKVPSQLTELNEKAYKPRAISFGPYHYGEEHLKPMEEHKHRALLHFLKRCGESFKSIFQKLDKVAQELRDSYKSLDSIWINDTSKFIKMMILDGCFILEFLGVNFDSNTPTDYDENDPVFGENGKVYLALYIKRDMLMLENQIPMTVLHTLLQIGGDEEKDHHELLNKKIIATLRGFSNRNVGKCLHVLDVYRKSVIQEPSYTAPLIDLGNLPFELKRTEINSETSETILLDISEEDEYRLNRTASELKEARINFKTSKTISLEASEEDEDQLNRSAMELKEARINFKSSETSLEVSEEDEDHLNQSAMVVKKTGINFKTCEPSLEVSEEDEDHLNESAMIVQKTGINFKTCEPSLEVSEEDEDHLNESAMIVQKTGINFKSSETSLEVSKEDEDHLNRSAIELKEAGISFKKSKTRSLKDVSFNRGVLRLPKLVVDDGTECMFLNLIAFELLHVAGTGKEVISFVCFMDTIIDSAVDVAILIRSGIIINYLESDKVVAKLFNSLAKEIPMDRAGELEKVRKSMIYYCKKPWKSWRASLIQTYFRNPWAMVSLVAAIFLFVLTIIQTIYTVGQFYQKD